MMMQWCTGRRRSGRIPQPSRSRRTLISTGKENIPEFRVPHPHKGSINAGYGSTDSLASSTHPTGFTSSGQVQLSFSASQTTLRVCVLQAHHLRLPASATNCNTFAQLSIGDESYSCTAEIRGSNNPIFKQSFAYNIGQVQMKGHRRLTIRLCHRDSRNGHVEILGSMSFGLRHLLSRVRRQDDQDGWYYLLNDCLGAKKHLRVQSRSKTASLSNGNLSAVNLDARNLPVFKIEIRKRADGYGFSLKPGCCPVPISTIRPGSSAHFAGLQSGDVILGIQGRNISRSCCKTVADLIRNVGSDLQLEIGRPSLSSSTLSLHVDDVIPEASSTHTVVIKNILEDFTIPEPETTNAVSERIMPSLLSTSTSSSPSHPPTPFFNQNIEELLRDSCSPIEKPHGGHARPEAASAELSPGVYSLDVSPARMPVAISMDLLYPLRLGESLCMTPKRRLCFSDDEADVSDVWEKLELSVITEEASPASPDHKRSRFFSSQLEHHDSSPGDEVQPASSDDDDEASFCSLLANIHSDQEISLDGTSQLRDCTRLDVMVHAYQQFMQLEQSFYEDMLIGIQNIVRPLRHRFSVTQHAAIFRNIEKLSLLSAHQVALLRSEEPEADMTSPKHGWRCIGDIYRSQLNVMRDAFGIFVRGVPEADLALRLAHVDEMDTVRELINRPLKYLDRLCLMLKTALDEEGLSHPEESLKNVVRGLEDVNNDLKLVLQLRRSTVKITPV